MAERRTLRVFRPGVTVVLAASLAACSMAPDYAPPQTATPPQFREVAGWSPATPRDGEARGEWWKSFGDPVLDHLEQRADAASPTLASALARYDQARAAVRASRADLFPQVQVGADAARSRLSRNRPQSGGSAPRYEDYSLGGSLDYELDLWGRVRNAVAANQAEAQASALDLASARLSLQAGVADAYMRLRGLDAEAQLLDRSVAAFTRALELMETRHRGGIVSGIDVNRARTVLGNAQAQVAAIANERAATEHELAALTGAIASDFSVAPEVEALNPPAIPIGTPSELLQRRPDIAAAERRVFAANADIGVARAAYFPSLTLGASGGWQSSGGDLLSSASNFWTLGPLSTVLALFDGGRRRAEVRISRARYEEISADYRSTVIAAFRQVEDAIAAIRHLSAEGAAQSQAAQAARRTSEIAMSRYREGASDYLDVVTAQTDALEAQRAYISVQTRRMQASVALVRAMGGAA